MRPFHTRRDFLKLVAVSAGTLCLGCELFVNKRSKSRPNIILFMADDLGWMDTTVNGSRYYETPNMQRLAKEGMVFTQAYSASPLCSPTRASIMTGLYPQRLKITEPRGHQQELNHEPRVTNTGDEWSRTVKIEVRRKLPLQEYTIAEALRDAGYRTCFFGKWHLGKDEKYWPHHQGFDINIGGTGFPAPSSYFSPYKNPRLKDGPKGQYITDRLTDDAIQYLEEHKNDSRPFLMFMWHYGVHSPYQAKPELIKHFRKKKDPRGQQDSPTMAAMIYSVDQSLGRIMDKLTELGRDKNTVIIFYSDNGGNMYDVVEQTTPSDDPLKVRFYDALDGTTPTNNYPLRGGKATVFEGGIRVPMIVKWPGAVKAGTKCDVPVSSEDLYPTILSMASVKPKTGKKLDGVDFVGLLAGQTKTLKRQALFCHYPHDNEVRAHYGAVSTVRKGDWKLHRYYCRGDDFTDKFELYNLKDDIGERNDLADKYPDKVAELRRLLEAHLRDTNAHIPLRNPKYDPNEKKRIRGLHPSAAKGKKLD